VVSTVAMFFVGYKPLVPLPAAPVSYAPFIMGVWLILDVVVLYVMKRRRRESWLDKTSQIAVERVMTEKELDARTLV